MSLIDQRFSINLIKFVEIFEEFLQKSLQTWPGSISKDSEHLSRYHFIFRNSVTQRVDRWKRKASTVEVLLEAVSGRNSRRPFDCRGKAFKKIEEHRNFVEFCARKS